MQRLLPLSSTAPPPPMYMMEMDRGVRIQQPPPNIREESFNPFIYTTTQNMQSQPINMNMMNPPINANIHTKPKNPLLADDYVSEAEIDIDVALRELKNSCERGMKASEDMSLTDSESFWNKLGCTFLVSDASLSKKGEITLNNMKETLKTLEDNVTKQELANFDYLKKVEEKLKLSKQLLGVLIRERPKDKADILRADFLIQENNKKYKEIIVKLTRLKINKRVITNELRRIEKSKSEPIYDVINAFVAELNKIPGFSSGRLQAKRTENTREYKEKLDKKSLMNDVEAELLGDDHHELEEDENDYLDKHTKVKRDKTGDPFLDSLSEESLAVIMEEQAKLVDREFGDIPKVPTHTPKLNVTNKLKDNKNKKKEEQKKEQKKEKKKREDDKDKSKLNKESKEKKDNKKQTQTTLDNQSHVNIKNEEEGEEEDPHPLPPPDYPPSSLSENDNDEDESDNSSFHNDDNENENKSRPPSSPPSPPTEPPNHQPFIPLS